MIVTLYGPMEEKARFSGLPGGAVGGGVWDYTIYRQNATVTNLV